MAKKIIALVLAALMVFALVGCGGGSSSSADASDNADAAADTAQTADAVEDAVQQAAASGQDTVVIGTTMELSALKQTGGFSMSYPVLGLVFDFGVFIDARTGDMNSDVLKDWYYEDDTHIYLEMYDDIYFSNGDQMTIDDFLFSMYMFIDDNASDAQQYLGYMFDEAEISDDHLSCVLPTDGVWGPGLSVGAFVVYDQAWVEEVGYDLTTASGQEWYEPVGSGPFEVIENIPGSSITLSRRNDYWGTCNWPESVQTVIFRQYNDSSAMYIDLESGNIDVAAYISSQDMDRAVAGESSGVSAVTTLSGEQIRFWINKDYEWMDEPAFREAIASAVDWAALAEICGGSLATSSLTPIPSFSKNDNPDVEGYTYDPDHARELLAGLGINDGDVVLNANVENKDIYLSMAETVQYYLGQVGITMKIESFDRVALTDRVSDENAQPNYAQIVGNSCFTGNPYSWMPLLFSSTGNYKLYQIKDEQADALWDEIMQMVDSDEKVAKYQELEAYLMDNYLMFPAIESLQGIAFDNTLISNAYYPSDYISVNLKNAFDWVS